MSCTITFTVVGNPDDPHGNPIPKAKLTSGQRWSEKAQRYVAWKGMVVTAFLDALCISQFPNSHIERRVAQRMKPLDIGIERAHMKIVCSWRDGAHPDAENVFGSIADALFYNDKCLSGEFDFLDYKKPSGQVDVTLTLPDGAFFGTCEQPKGAGKKRKKALTSAKYTPKSHLFS